MAATMYVPGLLSEKGDVFIQLDGEPSPSIEHAKQDILSDDYWQDQTDKIVIFQLTPILVGNFSVSMDWKKP